MTVAAQRSDPVDVRVADSPLVALRFWTDARLADLAEAGAEAERELIDATARRTNLRNHLRRNDETRRRMLEALDRYPIRDAVRAFHDGLALTGEFGLVEEQIASLKRRCDEIAAERETLLHVRETLRAISNTGGLRVDMRSARLSRAARRMYQMVDDEHQAVARTILDGPMQRLSDAALDAELVGRALPRDVRAAAEYAARCHSATVEAASALQRRIERLWPLDADHSLVQAVDDLLAAAASSGVGTLHVVGVERRLDSLLELSAYRIVEAAVDNGLRHGRASHVDVVVAFHADRLSVLVRDDGEGFDVSATEARLGRTRGLGLIQMHERAALSGGRVEVRSITGEGTEVRATLMTSRQPNVTPR